ncbi:conserved Plasmodium protein, unknown function [Plasmodium berghei]|uniref:CTLH domain-containing protein, putative n=2 Tax=Plasmodium berghei TaxID=5821 RepID=A0A509AQ92_PLABA|nr:CTLH domain-containing protein, putative [Plasmodium berghei ANKA]CXJ00263.1 conserved Plasmodium protein, unknown function [Plasmodium berghei]SCL97987.1 conserved Plasmodium protein, unknown function [Plasmodium berghei]SCM16728.1 conserved Plasmodium protein, unknown function [Plasmodium berghei]SCM18526.1 conserved Plasmodium protein, unknown function [Plasmodium berghei]SCN27959.1 conserved Plasmodium protein, unknown function [Plasmodium berghei]|eukprot:XP_034423612.1 CTLH domain-containing protein, putative [Plasmodium berghei ANKA]
MDIKNNETDEIKDEGKEDISGKSDSNLKNDKDSEYNSGMKESVNFHEIHESMLTPETSTSEKKGDQEMTSKGENVLNYIEKKIDEQLNIVKNNNNAIMALESIIESNIAHSNSISQTGEHVAFVGKNTKSESVETIDKSKDEYNNFVDTWKMMNYFILENGTENDTENHEQVGKEEMCDNKEIEKEKDLKKKKKVINVIDKYFVQIPLKSIMNVFRNIQKEMEKNFTIITLFIEKKLLNLNEQMQLTKINTIIEKLNALKKKVINSKKMLSQFIKKLHSRLEYIYEEEDIQVESLKRNFNFYSYEKRINWLIDGYFCRYGFFNTSELFCKRYKLDNYSDAYIYKEYLLILNELRMCNIKPGLEWCQKYKSQLKKMNSTIESELHLQHVIYLIFENKYFEALEYLKSFVIFANDKFISDDVKFVITYINVNYTDIEKLNAFNRKRWKKILKLFKLAYSDIIGTMNKPLLEFLLKSGISVIKTDKCEQHKKKSTNCPTCIDELKSIISQIPNIPKTKSFLLCPYTNQIMDENNPPFTTPTGHVFSEKAISMFLKPDDIFICPHTHERYRLDDFSRLFI